jgi:hypothetical protein
MRRRLRHIRAIRFPRVLLVRALALGVLGLGSGCGNTQVPLSVDSASDFDAEERVTDALGDTSVSDTVVTDAIKDVGSDPIEPVPAGITLRRLDKRAYTRTVQDLFQTQLRPGDTFPSEYAPGLFSHVAKGQSMTPYLVELYASAADAVTDDILKVREPTSLAWHIEAESLSLPHSFPVPGFGNALHDASPVVVSAELPESAEVLFSVRVYGQSWKGAPPVVQLRVDGELALQSSVASEEPVVLQTSAVLEAGLHKFSIQLYNPSYEEELFQSMGRLVYLDWLKVAAPSLPSTWVDPRSLLLSCDPQAVGEENCAREILERVLPRAWRRPVTDDELESILAFVMEGVMDGRGFERGLKVALEAVMLHPSFLFLVEEGDGISESEPTPVSGYELASRLSFFLWGTMPDKALFDAADDGSLHTAQGRTTQTQRLLSSPRSQALVEGLVEHWFLVQKLGAYGTGWMDLWFEPLRTSMVQEIHLFIASMFERNRPVQDLLLSSTVFVDGQLGAHYGLPAEGRAFVEVERGRSGRGGLLQMAGLLTVLSHPNRTSPVRRGKWVYEALLCGQVPPPPDAMEFSEMTEKLALTAKDELDMHLNLPECVGCHQLMDPLGLPLEKFDQLGGRRHLDEGIVIVPVGELPDGRIVEGAHELANALAEDTRFIDCVAQRFMTYALGREPLIHEGPLVDELVQDWAERGYGMNDLIDLIVNHPLFLSRVPASPAEPLEETP